MVAKIDLGDITLDVVKKDIKNVHLSVHPPTGRVRISAPLRMTLDTIRVFAVSKLEWIKKQQRRMRAQERETEREYLDRESHYVWGRRYLLEVIEADGTPGIELKHNRLIVRFRPRTRSQMKQAIVEEWYRNELKAAVIPLVDKWEPVIGVTVARIYVQHMKTKWGSCNTVRRNIRLNSELAKKPKEALEYVLVHELVHLRESSHGKRFVAFMDEFMPDWRQRRDMLNTWPVRHERWKY